MKWISVKDKLPTIRYMMNQSFIRVLVYSDKKVFGYIFHTFCEKCHEGKPIKNVTHWMYLPKKPKTDSAILKQ